MTRTLALSVLLLASLLTAPALADSSRPELIVTENLFTESQMKTLRRDANLAQRSGVPVLFAIVRADSTSIGSIEKRADDYRRKHQIETEYGADDGIVFVIGWIPGSPEQSRITYSAGEHAFDTTGLSPETIDAYLNDVVEPILESGQLFEASAYLMRYTRQTSLYVPPPPREIVGVAKLIGSALNIVAPAAAIAAILAMSRYYRSEEQARRRVILSILAGSLVVLGLAVWTHSRVTVLAVAVTLIALGIWALMSTRDPKSRPIPWRALFPDIALLLILIATSLAINMKQVEITPGDRDETRWLNRAYYATDLADPFGPTWQDYIITVGQPPLGSIAIGLGLAIQGEDLRATGVWDYQYDRNWYKATGGYPTDEALFAGRRTNAVIGALATGASYVLGRLLTNRIGGIAAGVYLAWHPLHIVLSTQALSDQTFALLLLLALIGAYRFAEKPTWGRAIALGIFLGLGGATKLTPLLLAPPLAVFGLLRLQLDRTPTGKRAGWMLVAQPGIAFATFVGIYPWLWENPIGRTWRLFAFRSQEMDAQTSAWPNALTDSPLHALARFGYKLTYTHSTSQKALRNVYAWLDIDRTPVGIDLVVAAIGGVLLLWFIARRGLWTPEALVSMLIAGELALLAIGMKADFYRYHLPVVMLVSALIAVAVGSAWSEIRESRFWNLYHRPNTSESLR